MRSGQSLQLSGARARRNPRRLPRAHPPRPIQSHPVRVRRPSSKRLSNSWPATATSKKAWASWPSPGADLPRSSLAPPSASLEKNSPFPPSSLTANWKTWPSVSDHYKPASNGRNDPATQICVSRHFSSKQARINSLIRASKEKCLSFHEVLCGLHWLGHFDLCWLV
jgi:hypothetical protein